MTDNFPYNKSGGLPFTKIKHKKMEFTGIAGQMLSWAVMITAYAIVLIGLYVAWTWIFDIVTTYILRSFKAYGLFIEFLCDRKKYKEKLMELEERHCD